MAKPYSKDGTASALPEEMGDLEKAEKTESQKRRPRVILVPDLTRGNEQERPRKQHRQVRQG